MTRGIARQGFDMDLEYGQIAEEKLAEILCDDSGRVKVEVKRDETAYKTGNLFIEIGRQDGYRVKPSGLSVTEADIWIIFYRPGLEALLIEVPRLKKLVGLGKKHGKEIRGGDYNMSVGVLVPIRWVIKNGV